MTERISPPWPEAQRARLFALLKALSVKHGDVTLASGQKSDFYVDCKQTMLTGEGHHLLGRLFFGVLKHIEQESGTPVVACSGMSVGADPLCSALSLTAFLGGRELPAVFVRKEAKGHGTGAYLEGTKTVPDGGRIVLLEDVVTTGGSTLKAAGRVRDAGYLVTDVIAIVDRQAGGAENLANADLRLHALFTKADFTKAAAS